MYNTTLALHTNKVSNNLEKLYSEQHLVCKFLGHKGVNSLNTKAKYESIICNFFNVRDSRDITVFMVMNIDTEKVEAQLNYMLSQELSVATIRNKLSVLSSLYDWIHDFYGTYQNPVKPILKHQVGKVEHKEQESLTLSEVKGIINSCDKSITGLRNKMLLVLAVTTGMRVSELVNIKFKDVFYKEHSYISFNGKGNKPHKAKLQQVAIKAIEEYVEVRYPEGEYKSNDYLIDSHSRNNFGGQMTSTSVNKIITKIAQSVGLTGVTPHTLRRTCATLAYTAGEDTLKIRDMLGHASANTTYRYIKSTDKLVNHASNSFVDMFEVI